MNPLRVGLLFSLLTALCGTAAWAASASQAFSPSISTTSPRGNSFAVVEIVKPTYTPPPTATATLTPLPTSIPTETPQPMAEAVIVDSPERAYAAQLEAETPVNYTGGKYILVDISEQHMYVYEGDLLVFSFVASTGMNNATRTGNFSVLDKIPNAYGATWDIWMPNWLGIYWAGSLENGIHALPILPNGATLWAGFLGTPISYGCIVLDTYDSQLLFDWAEVGIPVEIQW